MHFAAIPLNSALGPVGVNSRALVDDRLTKVPTHHGGPDSDPLKLRIEIPRVQQKIRKKYDSRLPLALKTKLRKKRLKHRFDDAAEEPKKKKPKQPRIVIIEDSDDEEQSSSSAKKMVVVEKRTQNSISENPEPPVTITKPREVNTATPEGVQGVQIISPLCGETDKLFVIEDNPEPAVINQPSKKTPDFDATVRAVTPPHYDEQSLTSNEGEKEKSARRALEFSTETTEAMDASVATETGERPSKSDDTGDKHKGERPANVAQLQQQLDKIRIGKGSKNRIRPDSVFADAVDEVEKEDDDSVGSGSGADKSSEVKITPQPQFRTSSLEEQQDELMAVNKSYTKYSRSFDFPGEVTFATVGAKGKKADGKHDLMDAFIPLGPDVSKFFQLPCMADDRAEISEYHRLILDNVEIFRATTADVVATPKKVLFNSLGVRCIHCAREGVKRTPAQISFPGRPDLLASSIIHVGGQHLSTGKCPSVPEEMRRRLQEAKEAREKEGNNKKGAPIRTFAERLVSVCNIVQVGTKYIKLRCEVPPEELIAKQLDSEYESTDMSDEEDDEMEMDGDRRASIEIMDDDTKGENEPGTPGRKTAWLRSRRRRGQSTSSSATTSPQTARGTAITGAVVTDSSDSEASCSYTFKADSDVGRCERISKDYRMEAEIVEFRRQTAAAKSPYHLSKFLKLWEMVEEQELGTTAMDIEGSNDFRRANHNVQKHDSREQRQAQYGRILPKAMDDIFKLHMNLDADSTFVDLGHGIGNTCLQASYTIGCRSKGIELVDARYFTSEALHRCLAKVANKKRERKPCHWDRKAGLVDLRHGRLEDPANHEWLTENVNHVFVNNFNDVFGLRSEPKKAVNGKAAATLDSRIAAMFARMKPGSIMITLHPIDHLGLTRESAIDHREKHKMYTPEGTDASFYSAERINLGQQKDLVSWSEDGGCTDDVLIYKYTRLQQPLQGGEPVFLCTNEKKVRGQWLCDKAKNATPIPATVNGDNGLLMNSCKCNFVAIKTRAKTTGTKPTNDS